MSSSAKASPTKKMVRITSAPATVPRGTASSPPINPTVGALVGRRIPPVIVLILVSLAFATLGALQNMHEEIIALIPVMLVLSRGLGFGAVSAVAMRLIEPFEQPAVDIIEVLGPPQEVLLEPGSGEDEIQQPSRCLVNEPQHARGGDEGIRRIDTQAPEYNARAVAARLAAWRLT